MRIKGTRQVQRGGAQIHHDGALVQRGGAWITALLVGALALTACGSETGDPAGSTGGTPAADDEPSAQGDEPNAAGDTSAGIAGFPDCAGLENLRADESLYRDEPVYGNADDLVHEVREWASAQPGFAEIGLDRERNGWVTVWVKDADTEGLQQEVAQRWPGEGIVVVEAPWSSAELEGVRSRVETALREAGVQTAGSGVMAHQGVVGIYLGVITPEAEDVLAQFAGEPLCVEGMPASQVPEDKEQPTAGPGWRLLGEAESGEVYRTGVATTDEQLATLWGVAGLGGEAPEVDWDSEIAVWFGAVYGSGCPVRMDGVVVEGDLLHADLVTPGAVFGCNDDANPHAFVVAVSREELPDGPFRVQLGSDDPPGGAPEERTLVDVDLRAAGSTATDEQIHLDPSLAQPREAPLVVDGDALPTDDAVRYVYRDDSSCDVPTLGPLDGSVWRLADREAPWDVADGDEITLYPLGGSDQELIASSPQMDWMFRRLPEGQTCP